MWVLLVPYCRENDSVCCMTVPFTLLSVLFYQWVLSCVVCVFWHIHGEIHRNLNLLYYIQFCFCVDISFLYIDITNKKNILVNSIVNLYNHSIKHKTENLCLKMFREYSMHSFMLHAKMFQNKHVLLLWCRFSALHGRLRRRSWFHNAHSCFWLRQELKKC